MWRQSSSSVESGPLSQGLETLRYGRSVASSRARIMSLLTVQTTQNSPSWISPASVCAASDSNPATSAFGGHFVARGHMPRAAMRQPDRRARAAAHEGEGARRPPGPHREHEGIVGIQRQQPISREGHDSLDAVQILARVDAIRTDVVVEHVEDAGHVGRLDAQPAFEECPRGRSRPGAARAVRRAVRG